MVKNLQEKISSKEIIRTAAEFSKENLKHCILEKNSSEIDETYLIQWMKSNTVQPSEDVIDYIMKKIK